MAWTLFAVSAAASLGWLLDDLPVVAALAQPVGDSPGPAGVLRRPTRSWAAWPK